MGLFTDARRRIQGDRPCRAEWLAIQRGHEGSCGHRSGAGCVWPFVVVDPDVLVAMIYLSNGRLRQEFRFIHARIGHCGGGGDRRLE